MGRILCALAIILAVLAAATAVDRPMPPADLVWIEPADFNTLDPQQMSHTPDMRLASALFEGLVRYDTMSADMRPVPALARSWEISSDGLTYTFHLDPAARWSNGDLVTAGDFIHAWKRALLPETGADYLNMFHLIRGGADFTEFRRAQLKEYAARDATGRTADAARVLLELAETRFREAVAVRARGAHTLEVSLARPVPYFLDLCALAAFLPVHRATVERFTDLDAGTGALRPRRGWTKPPALVCNGPYIIQRWRFKRDMRLAPNPHYRDPALARSRTIEIRIIEDANTALLAFQGGSADWHSDLEADYIGDLLEAQSTGTRHDLRALDAFGTYFWSFNCAPTFTDGRANPFHDARVRRAFALAVDKDAIVRRIRRGAERPAATFIPPASIPGYRSPAGLGMDAARARRELADAGWMDRDSDGVPENAQGEPFPTVELLCTPVGAHKDVAQALGRMWHGALGVRTTIVMRETKVYRSNLKQRDYMIARGAWFGDYLDPTTFLDIHRSGDGNNDRAYSDPAFDALLAAADSENDAGRRMTLLAEAERLLVEEAMPVLPIWHYTQYYLARPAEGRRGLRGLSVHPRLMQYPFLLEVAP